MVVIGIDLGTTNSLAVAYRDDQKGVELIPNQFGEFLTPSVVSMEGEEVLVGKVAKERLVTQPEATAHLFKPAMGQDQTFQLGKRSYRPEELSAAVLKQLVIDAESYLGEKVDELVISVPAYFNAEQRQATKRAGELIGLKVERLINEPSAAAIACRNWNNQEDPKDFESFVVFDLGGGTLDISVVDCFENVISIVSIAGDNHLGGSDFDRAIAQYAALEWGLDFESLSKQEQRSLLLEAERAKIRLQDSEETLLSFKEDQLVLSRSLVTAIAGPLLQRVQKVLKKALVEGGMEPSELDSLIMVGGSSYSPVIRDYLIQTLRLPIVQKGNLDYLVAEGLGTYIAIKERQLLVKDLVVTDICPFTLSTSIRNEQDLNKPLSSVLIPRNSVLPTSKKGYYSTTTPYQEYIQVDVRQGESLYADENLFLGSYRISVTPRQEPYDFEVTYSYDINSLLYVEIFIEELNESHTLILGDKKKLIPVEELDHLRQIKESSIQLAQLDEVQAVLEHAQRLYEEVPKHLQAQVKRLILDYSARVMSYEHQLKKKKEVTDQMKEILERLEMHLNSQLRGFFQEWDYPGFEDEEN